jgi:NAD-dependent oxidoreductase involved in siderophore biosynthesis
MHSIELGMYGGALCLPDTHGPLLWRAQPSFPTSVRAEGESGLFRPETEHAPTILAVADGAPDYGHVFARDWLDGVRTALSALRSDILRDADVLDRGRFDLALCRAWQDLAARLGPPRPTDARGELVDAARLDTLRRYLQQAVPDGPRPTKPGP